MAGLGAHLEAVRGAKLGHLAVREVVNLSVQAPRVASEALTVLCTVACPVRAATLRGDGGHTHACHGRRIVMHARLEAAQHLSTGVRRLCAALDH